MAGSGFSIKVKMNPVNKIIKDHRSRQRGKSNKIFER